LNPATTVIASGSRVLGEIHSENELMIEGVVEGRLILQGGVVVQRDGRVKGDVQAEIVKISGTIEGDVQARDHIEILREGRVRGNVAAPRVQINDGAFFKGAIDMSAQAGGREESGSNAPNQKKSESQGSGG